MNSETTHGMRIRSLQHVLVGPALGAIAVGLLSTIASAQSPTTNAGRRACGTAEARAIVDKEERLTVAAPDGKLGAARTGMRPIPGTKKQEVFVELNPELFKQGHQAELAETKIHEMQHVEVFLTLANLFNAGTIRGKQVNAVVQDETFQAIDEIFAEAVGRLTAGKASTEAEAIQQAIQATVFNDKTRSSSQNTVEEALNVTLDANGKPTNKDPNAPPITLDRLNRVRDARIDKQAKADLDSGNPCEPRIVPPQPPTPRGGCDPNEQCCIDPSLCDPCVVDPICCLVPNCNAPSPPPDPCETDLCCIDPVCCGNICCIDPTFCDAPPPY